MGTKKQYCIGCEARGIKRVADFIIEHEGEKIPCCKACRKVLLTQLQDIIWKPVLKK